MGSASATSEKKAESLTPETEEKSDVQVEPTQEEMERERLASKAEQVCSVPPAKFKIDPFIPLYLPASRRDPAAA